MAINQLKMPNNDLFEAFWSFTCLLDLIHRNRDLLEYTY